jgi:hypothetical protein
MCIQIMMPVNEGVDMGSHSGILEFKVSLVLQTDAIIADGQDERARR